MANNWTALDGSFPTFKGDENPKEMIGSIVNYLFVMKEQLQYSLNNLTADNWNATALQTLSEEQQSDVVTMLAAVTAQLAAMIGRLNRLEARVDALEQGDGGAVEGLSTAVQELQEQVNGLSEAVQVTLEGTTVGKEGVPLYLVGQVFANGTEI